MCNSKLQNSIQSSHLWDAHCHRLARQGSLNISIYGIQERDRCSVSLAEMARAHLLTAKYAGGSDVIPA